MLQTAENPAVVNAHYIYQVIGVRIEANFQFVSILQYFDVLFKKNSLKSLSFNKLHKVTNFTPAHSASYIRKRYICYSVIMPASRHSGIIKKGRIPIRPIDAQKVVRPPLPLGLPRKFFIVYGSFKTFSSAEAVEVLSDDFTSSTALFWALELISSTESEMNSCC